MKNFLSIHNKINNFKKAITVSGDKSISIRWALFSSLANGVSTAKNLLLSETFGVNTIPQNIFVKSDGKEIGRIEGFLPPDLFVIELQKILKN